MRSLDDWRHNPQWCAAPTPRSCRSLLAAALHGLGSRRELYPGCVDDRRGHRADEGDRWVAGPKGWRRDLRPALPSSHANGRYGECRHGFENPEFVERLDVVFAGLYFDAEAAIASGAQCPVAWRPLIETRSQPRANPVRARGYVRAHRSRSSDRDRHHLRGARARADDGSVAHRDYQRVDGLLATVETQVAGWFDTALIADIEDVTPERTDEQSRCSRVAARDVAWQHAKLLWRLRVRPAPRWLPRRSRPGDGAHGTSHTSSSRLERDPVDRAKRVGNPRPHATCPPDGKGMLFALSVGRRVGPTTAGNDATMSHRQALQRRRSSACRSALDT